MKQDDVIIVNCPTCQKSVEWLDKNLYRPFCSKRCQLIDLGDWANEEHKIPVEEMSEQELWSEDNIVEFLRNND